MVTRLNMHTVFSQVKDAMQGKMVTASGLGLYQAKVNEDSSFTIDTLGQKSGDFDVLITGPPDAIPPYEAIPLRCYQQKDGRLLVEFTPVTTGVHKVEVLEKGRLIRGAPFECHAFNPDDVYIVDVPAQDGHPPGKVIRFKVDRRRAGLADLEVVVTSPVGEALPVEVKALTAEAGVDLVEFRPDVSGQYKFVVHYGGDLVPDSPVSFTVREPAMAAAAAQAAAGNDANVDMRAFGQGLQKGQVG